MRKELLAVAVVCAAIQTGCGGSPEEAEIARRYQSFRDGLLAGDTDSLEAYLDGSSLRLLQAMAEGWESLCPGCRMDRETIMYEAFLADSSLVPAGEVERVAVRTDSALLILLQRGGRDTLVFLRQGDGWLLDLSPALRREVDRFLEGTSLSHRNLVLGRWPERVRRWRESL